MKKLLSVFLILLFALVCNFSTNIDVVKASQEFAPEENVKASILMDASGQHILFANNEHEKMPVASIVKLMTILLTLEEIETGNLSLDDIVVVSENASGMGGSQIFLDSNSEYKVENLLKSVIVSSANDSSVALAEHIAGSESNFVEKMNARAKELGLQNTNYVNCNGLPVPNQYSCAEDVAKLMSKLTKYETYKQFSKIWMEDFIHPTGRISEMVNTNKLVRHYEGCTCGKTGSTSEAGYCLAVSAKRNNMDLISVVLGASNSKERFKYASDLLNYGFANYYINQIFNQDRLNEQKITLQTDKTRTLKLVAEKDFCIISPKQEKPVCSLNFNLPNKILSTKEGEIIGHVEIIRDGAVIETINILSAETIEAPSLIDYIKLINEDFVA